MNAFLKAISLACVIGAAATAAFAAEPATFEIAIKDHKFDPAELRVPAGTPLILKVRNLDPTVEEFESHSLKVEKIIPGGAMAGVRVRPLEPGRYEFMGEFHADQARGVVIAE